MVQVTQWYHLLIVGLFIVCIVETVLFFCRPTVYGSVKFVGLILSNMNIELLCLKMSPTRNYSNCTFPRLVMYTCTLPILLHLVFVLFQLTTMLFHFLLLLHFYCAVSLPCAISIAQCFSLYILNV